MRLHRWLLDEYKRDGSFSWGKSIVGYATLVLAIIIISGIVIWYPRNKKVLRNRLKVKTKAGWFRFFYDLHVSGGFYAAFRYQPNDHVNPVNAKISRSNAA